MKVKITFEHDPRYLPFAWWAKAEGFQACGESVEEAERRLKAKLAAHFATVTVLDPKEVEI